jgi:hypothetical protein
MDFMTREVFDTLIILCIIIGLFFAVRRLKADLTRPLPKRPTWADDDTAEHQFDNLPATQEFDPAQDSNDPNA